MPYRYASVPPEGEKITFSDGRLSVPDHPILPFIEGDGTGPDIWRASVRVFDAAVEKAYGGRRRIEWTQVGGGIRSLNVALRKLLDLYVCLRPVRHLRGVPSPVKHPEYVDIVIFRENTEDVYDGVEFEMGTPANRAFFDWLKANDPEQYAKVRFPSTSGVSLKPVSREGTERLVRAAIRWSLDNGRRSVTLVHKGNIMKFTEGAFRNWGYALAEKEFADLVYTW